MTDDPPRDPSDYEPTTHFMSKCKYRCDPSPSPSIAAAVIRDGEVVPLAGQAHQVVFEAERGPHTWRVVADVREGMEPPYPLVTIYAVDAHGPGRHDEVFEREAGRR